MGHHIAHSVLKLEINDYAKNEVVAELSAYLLMIQFIENVDYNFKYSNIWSNQIKDTFRLQEFEQYFVKLSQSFSKFF